MKKTLIFGIVVASLALSGCGGGGGTQTSAAGEAQKAAEATGASYTVDAAKSVVGWLGSKAAYNHVGTVKIKSGSLAANGANITGGAFVIDMSTIMENGTGTFNNAAKATQLADHLKTPDFFDVPQFPESKFEITGAEPGADASTQTIKGNLTIKGITKNISFPATVTQTGDNLSAKATFKVNRADFDVRYKSGTFEQNLGDELISDDIEFSIDLAATKAAH